MVSPLLSQLFRFREDCAFVVATHDVMLPVDNPEARVLLVRSCTYSGQTAVGWETDLIPANADIDEKLKQDIVGSRRKILFVEGDGASLDSPLYSLIFPAVSVRAKGSSRDVEQAVQGIRSSESMHWVRAWGIVDNDGRDLASISSLRAAGVFALPFYSIESIYYHPDMIARVAVRHAATLGGNGPANAAAAVVAALSAAEPHFQRLAARAVEKTIRKQIFASLPTLSEIQAMRPVAVNIETSAIIRAEADSLRYAAQKGDWLRVLTRCPVRETPALAAIARAVGLRDRHQYESAVLQLLREDDGALALARGFFGDLVGELELN
jgi:hypothetical protein